MKKKQKYETCAHVISIGERAVYVQPTCRHVYLIKGVLVTSKKTCQDCEFWKEREDKSEVSRHRKGIDG